MLAAGSYDDIAHTSIMYKHSWTSRPQHQYFSSNELKSIMNNTNKYDTRIRHAAACPPHSIQRLQLCPAVVQLEISFYVKLSCTISALFTKSCAHCAALLCSSDRASKWIRSRIKMMWLLNWLNWYYMCWNRHVTRSASSDAFVLMLWYICCCDNDVICCCDYIALPR